MQIASSIYFLKVPELKALAQKAALSPKGSKQTLINTLLHFIEPNTKEQTSSSAKTSCLPRLSAVALSKIKVDYDPNQYIIPGVYSNNKKYRALFKNMIGPHFSFKSYGMDWIKDKWKSGEYPSYEEFANYWQQEYERRKTDDSFSSPDTLQRVNFFRMMKGKGHTKEALEASWKEKRELHARYAKQYLLAQIDKVLAKSDG
ncbi:hypothetical protein PN836_010575 [Ningiella sp. W23]|uniref:SAP domain-containing protein n=1 Tax=Ningiella sp. W23 TaxID=3023715 RepID=UPI00375835CB